MKDPRPSSKPAPNLEGIESYQQKIEEEALTIKELDSNIAIIMDKISKQRHQMGGINASRDTANALNKQLRILENRLDKANQKFNEAIARNKKLRELIDNLRRERVIFDNIYQKLEKELHDRRKEMANIIEAANSAYEDRDRAQDQLASLKQQAEREQVEFEKEWRELNALIEKDKKMKDFLRLKQQERETGESEQPRAEDENKTKKKGMSANVITAERVKSYEEAFNKIQAATGIKDIEELVVTFISAEEKNFTLFKFVNELSNDIEMLETGIQELQAEVLNYKGKDAGASFIKKSILKDLEGKLEKYENKSELYELKYQNALKTINALKISLQNMFTGLECDKQFASEFLGEQVTETNMVQYLGLIEQRASEILQAYALLQTRKGRADFAMPGPQAPTSTNQIRIEAPNVKDDLTDEEEEDLDEDKPLTAEEFKLRAEKRAQTLRLQQRTKFKQAKRKK